MPAIRPEQRILWVDGVGGYLVCDQSELTVGQAMPGNQVDLPIVGDISRRAAVIRRSEDSYLLQPLQKVSVNGELIDRTVLLRSGDRIQIGERTELKFSKPHPLSASAVMTLLSHHRWQPAVDGVLFLAESCVLGPKLTSHIHCHQWSGEVILFKNRDQLMCRSSLPVEWNGKQILEPIALSDGHRVQGPDFSFCLETSAC